MKRTNLIYWTTTILFVAFMLSSAIPDIMMIEDATKFMAHLGYPDYFTPFIGWAKVLGCVALLLPGFPKIREWAYAGMFFDLIGAVYSVIMVEGFQPGMLVMIPVFGLAATSYWYNQKRS